MDYTIPDLPKQLREALCVAQGAVTRTIFDNNHREPTLKVLQHLLDECDRHRPLGPDGKHGNRHTDTCGCEDKPTYPKVTTFYPLPEGGTAL